MRANTITIRFNVLKVGIAAVALLAVLFGAVATAAAAVQQGPQPPAVEPAGPQQPDSVDATCPAGGQCFADVPAGNPFYANINKLYQQDIISGYACNLTPSEPCDDQNRPYFRWGNNVTRGQLAKIADGARSLPGMVISSTLNTVPIEIRTPAFAGILATATSGTAIWGNAQQTTQAGVYGFNTVGHGVWGRSAGGAQYAAVFGESQGNGFGVYGVAPNNNGVYGVSGGNAAGVRGESTGSGAGILGSSSAGHGVVGIIPGGSGRYAVYATGDMRVTGTCDGCALATYKLDNPADPANSYLNHAAVVSSELLNVYNGNVTLDAGGSAVVRLPDWFESVNKDFRYQLTPVNAAGPGLYVSQEIKDGSFKISGGTAGGKVSWQVSAVRADRVAESNPLQVVQEKPASERGTYWNPALYNQPASKGIGTNISK